jgi:hypothetical protein
MDAVKVELTNGLMVMVGGVRSLVSPDQIRQHLSQFYQVTVDQVQVKWYSRADFLLIFSNRLLVDWVLHSVPPRGMDLLLVFWRWSRQAGALFQPIRFKVLLSVTKVSAHVWSLDAIQAIIGSSYLVFEASPRSVTGSILSSFYVVAHLDTLTSSLLRWLLGS